MKHLHGIKLGEQIATIFPIRLYFPLAKNLIGLFFVLITVIIFFYAVIHGFLKHHAIGPLVFGIVIALTYSSLIIWSFATSFKRLFKNVKFWGGREPVLVMTAIGMSYLDLFSLQWKDITDVQLYDLVSGGRNRRIIPQIVIITSIVPIMNLNNTLEYRYYEKQKKFIAKKIKDEYLDFPIERAIILDARGFYNEPQKIAEIIKQIWDENKNK